jgi:hypothetical protein
MLSFIKEGSFIHIDQSHSVYRVTSVDYNTGEIKCYWIGYPKKKKPIKVITFTNKIEIL